MYKFKKYSAGPDEFAFGMMWGGKRARRLSIFNSEDVLLAVNKAYGDMSPRTIKNLGKIPTKIKKTLKEDLSKEITNTVTSLAENKVTYDVFDKIHDNLCMFFLDKFNSMCEDYNKTAIDEYKIKENKNPSTNSEKFIFYGKAQKIINMTFKYLYLFEDARGHEDNVFMHCHMAIDNYILNYCKKTLHHDPIYEIFQVAWSNLSRDEYIYMQNVIKFWITNYDITNFKRLKGDITFEYNLIEHMSVREIESFDFPFYAEFYIWNFQQTLEAEIYKIKEAKKLLK